MVEMKSLKRMMNEYKTLLEKYQLDFMAVLFSYSKNNSLKPPKIQASKNIQQLLKRNKIYKLPPTLQNCKWLEGGGKGLF